MLEVTFIKKANLREVIFSGTLFSWNHFTGKLFSWNIKKKRQKLKIYYIPLIEYYIYHLRRYVTTRYVTKLPLYYHFLEYNEL